MNRLALFLLALPIGAQAESVSIRSGEHETFSRLVLSIGEGADWDVVPNSDGYVLELTGVDDGFDVSAVFDRIPKTRISDVIQESPNSLALTVNCECYADAFLWRPGELVLDIVDGSDPDVLIAVPPPSRPVEDGSSDATLTLPNLLDLRSASPLPVLALEIPMADQGPLAIPELQATEDALLEGLAKAASQGFLDLSVQPRIEPEGSVAAENFPKDQHDLPGPIPTIGRPGVGISSAMDRDLALIGDVLSATTGQRCLPDDLFDIATWADERGLHEQIAELAESLAGEFGQEPFEAEDKLARIYIHFGFGAESRAVLRAQNAKSQSRQVLVELASIIDEYPGPYPLIATQMGCPTAAALWAFFAGPQVLDDDKLNHVLQQFFTVPQPLRGQIAPRLARKFVEIGNLEVASRILSASDNHDVELTHDVPATRALIAEKLNNPQVAIAVLEREVSDNVRTTPASLIRFIELELQQGQVPSGTDLELAATMRQENRGTSIEESLAVIEARGRIAMGQYNTALGLVSASQTPEALSVADEAFLHMTENASTSSFLELSFAELPEGISASTENEMARRLIEIGFPARASDFLRGPAERSAASERRYLRAEAFIGMGKFSEAIQALSGMNDPRAQNLRAIAFSGMGDYREALASSDPSEVMSNGGTLEFRAAAWERLMLDDDEVLSTFAQAILTPSVATPAETLADRRAILAQSEQSRRAIEGLLLRYDGATAQE